ncbi:Pentatricopeptide repeat-containing protein [Spatholobus suberectus]|nr:Pentatricopeptide repeat-containing protein [Spatholobus suberectus]
MRKLMKAKGIRKSPGCSWIEVDNRVHVFTVDDTSHPQIKEIYIKLEEMMKKIENTGRYVSVNSSVHRSQKFHSEKLAFAFGLLSLPSWMPIYVANSKHPQKRGRRLTERVMISVFTLKLIQSLFTIILYNINCWRIN